MSIDPPPPPPPPVPDDNVVQVPRTRQLLTPIRTSDASAPRTQAPVTPSSAHRSATYHHPPPPHSAVPQQTVDPTLAVPAAAHNRVTSMDAATGAYYQSPPTAPAGAAAAGAYQRQSHHPPPVTHHQPLPPSHPPPPNDAPMPRTHSRHSSTHADRHAVPILPSAPPGSAHNTHQQTGLQRIRRTTLNTATGDWALGKTIGAGSMGKVKLAWNMATNETVCIWSCFNS